MFAPGTIVSEFTSKKGNLIVLRLPREDDLRLMTDYINRLSKEDTFITFSGEQVSLEEEKKYLDSIFEYLAKGDGFFLLACHNDQLVGSADVTRMTRRSKHVGHFNISVAEQFRQEGIGAQMMHSLFELAQKIGLQMLQLSVYSVNEHGQYLYKKMGFEEVGRIPKKALFHGDLVDEIIMIKNL